MELIKTKNALSIALGATALFIFFLYFPFERHHNFISPGGFYFWAMVQAVLIASAGYFSYKAAKSGSLAAKFLLVADIFLTFALMVPIVMYFFFWR